jgi:HWE histidine kinase
VSIAGCWITAFRSGSPFAGYIGSCVDITERKQAEDHKDLLVAELDHRVKNTLACVAAIAEQTRATSNSMDEFLEVLRGRIRSLANTHSLLSRNRWQGVDLAELVRRELASCMRDANTLIDGPAIDVGADFSSDHEWFETGGPPVVAHSVPGYGTSVSDLIPYELGGTVDYVLAADGVLQIGNTGQVVEEKDKPTRGA